MDLQQYLVNASDALADEHYNECRDFLDDYTELRLKGVPEPRFYPAIQHVVCSGDDIAKMLRYSLPRDEFGAI